MVSVLKTRLIHVLSSEIMPKKGDLSRRTDKDKDPANVETQPTTISGFGDHSELNIFGRKRK